MKVKILKNTVADKKPVKAGDIVDLKDKEAKYLVGIKKATTDLKSGDKKPPKE
jgi:hypothetical protein